jgi:hypothetical protein
MSTETPVDEFAPLDDITDGWNTDERCPYRDCGAQLGELYEYLHRGDEDATFDCPSCERPVELETWTQFILKRPRPRTGG